MNVGTTLETFVCVFGSLYNIAFNKTKISVVVDNNLFKKICTSTIFHVLSGLCELSLIPIWKRVCIYR